MNKFRFVKECTPGPENHFEYLKFDLQFFLKNGLLRRVHIPSFAKERPFAHWRLSHRLFYARPRPILTYCSFIFSSALSNLHSLGLHAISQPENSWFHASIKLCYKCPSEQLKKGLCSIFGVSLWGANVSSFFRISWINPLKNQAWKVGVKKG